MEDEEVDEGRGLSLRARFLLISNIR